MRQELSSAQRSSRSLPESLRLYIVLLGVLDLVDLIWQKFINQHLLHRPWPYASPLLDQGPVVDLIVYVRLMPFRRTPAFFHSSSVPFMYPAPVALLYGAFAGFKDPGRVFTISILLVAALSAALFAWRMSLRGINLVQISFFVLATVIFSYPLAFEIRQGNMEAWIALIVGSGVWCYWRKKHHMAACLFGAAAALKLFPFVYLGLFLGRRRFSPILTGVASAAALTVVGLLYISTHPLQALKQIGANLDYWRWSVVLKVRTKLGYDHSLFSVVKQTSFLFLHPRQPSADFLNVASHIYMPCVALFGIALWFGRVGRLPFANKVLCLVVASVLLPPNSFDYTLLHLYVAGGVLAFVAVQQPSLQGLRLAFALLALVTAFEGELVWNFHLFAGQFKAVALLALLIVSARYPFPMTSNISADATSATAS